MKRTLVALLVLVALVGFGFQTQAFAGTCTKTLCWGLSLFDQQAPVLNNNENGGIFNAKITANVDCNLKALKTKAFCVTGSLEFCPPTTNSINVNGGPHSVVVPLVGTLQTIPVSVSGDMVAVNSSRYKKPVMSLVGSFPIGDRLSDAFVHIIFYDCDLEDGWVYVKFPNLEEEFSSKICRVSCKLCPCKAVNGEE
jgi:hypothetical protein